MTMPRSLSVNPETFAFGAGSLLKLLFLIGNRGCKEFTCWSYKKRLKSHNVCDEPGKHYLFCFCFTPLRNSEDFYTCPASVRRKRNSCTSATTSEKPLRFEEINQNIEFLSTCSLNVNKETNKGSFRFN